MGKSEKVRCAIYTRKSHEDGLDQEYNSLDAQYESAENYIISQKFKGWTIVPERYDDGGFSGGNTERPALKRLLADVEAGKIDIIVIYKLDRLSRSLVDFMNLADVFEQHNVSFVSVTQDINTSTSAGRMMMNILMTFAQYEREVIAERIRDKIAGAKRRGKHCGGKPILGYDANPQSKVLEINDKEAKLVRLIYDEYLKMGSSRVVAAKLNEQGYKTKSWTSRKGKKHSGGNFSGSGVNYILNNETYIGKVRHYDKIYDGEHEPIVDMQTWEKAKDLLEHNRKAFALTRTSLYSAFKGLLKCGYCGRSLMITYARKGEKKYFYYLCNKYENSGKKDCPLARIPCWDIEKIILRELGKMFNTPTMIAEILGCLKSDATIDNSEIVGCLNSIEEIWNDLFPGEKTRLARMLIDNVVVFRDKLLISIKKAGLSAMIQELKANSEPESYFEDDNLITVTVPIRIKRSHGRKVIVSPEMDEDSDTPTPLAKRLALAHKWNYMLISGRAESVNDLVDLFELDRAYIGHTLKMVTLAPELQRSILAGNEPENLNIINLRKAVPEDWQEQHLMYC